MFRVNVTLFAFLTMTRGGARILCVRKSLDARHSKVLGRKQGSAQRSHEVQLMIVKVFIRPHESDLMVSRLYHSGKM